MKFYETILQQELCAFAQKYQFKIGNIDESIFFLKKALTKVSEMCILLLSGRKNVSRGCSWLFCGSRAIRFSYRINMKRFSILGNQHQKPWGGDDADSESDTCFRSKNRKGVSKQVSAKTSKKAQAGAVQAVHKVPLKTRLAANWQLYLLLLIPVVITIIYKYIPMYGIQIAFRDFKASKGYLGSEWVGLYWFQRFFSSPNCVRMIRNTVLLSLYSLLWSFPVPIILSLAINQLRFGRFKRVVQTVLYAPHFISTMVICGMIRIFLSPSGGLINLILGTQTDFLTLSGAFRTIYISSGIWQDAGWGTIIYLATLSSVDKSLYEAAKVDGASMFQRILNIDVPALIPMAVIQLIMSAGGLMNIGFEKVWLLQTDLNKATSDVIAVYVYEQGIENAKYSYSTAVGLFNTLVNIVLLIIVNKIASKASDVSFV